MPDDNSRAQDRDADETLAPTDPPAADEPAADESADGQPATFQNRAARRAKAPRAGQPQPHGQAKHLGGRGSVQGPRQWGNRRSG